MAITPQNIARHELIGLKAKIVSAKNKANENMEGKIVDETYRTFTIETKKGEKKILKNQASFQVKIPSGEIVEIEGRLLEGRAWDRIKKRAG